MRSQNKTNLCVYRCRATPIAMCDYWLDPMNSATLRTTLHFELRICYTFRLNCKFAEFQLRTHKSRANGIFRIGCEWDWMKNIKKIWCRYGRLQRTIHSSSSEACCQLIQTRENKSNSMHPLAGLVAEYSLVTSTPKVLLFKFGNFRNNHI